VETDPLNHPAIPAANAGHQCTPEHPASLVDPSEPASQSARGSLRQVEALDYAGAQLDSLEHHDNLPKSEGIPEEGL
jgi:hypothetical protein